MPPARDLVDLRRELARHVVELTPERRKLVAPLDRHRPAEVTVGEPARGLQEPRDLGLEGADDHDGREKRQEEEPDQDRADQEPTVSDRALERGLPLEHAHLRRRTNRLGQVGEPPAVLPPCNLHVAGTGRLMRGLLNRRRDHPARARQADDQPGRPADVPHVVRGRGG